MLYIVGYFGYGIVSTGLAGHSYHIHIFVQQTIPNKTVQKMLASIFESFIARKLKPWEDRVNKIKICDDNITKEIEKLINIKKENNVIITGMEE